MEIDNLNKIAAYSFFFFILIFEQQMKINTSPRLLRWFIILATYLCTLIVWVRCLESFTATRLDTESQNLAFDIPQYRVEESLKNYAGIVDESLQLKSQGSGAGASKTLTFDLNELPADTGSELSHNQYEKIYVPRGETNYNQAFKRKSVESVDIDIMRHKNLISPSKRIELGLSAGSSIPDSKNANNAAALASENEIYMAPARRVPENLHLSCWANLPSMSLPDILRPREASFSGGFPQLINVNIYNKSAMQKTRQMTSKSTNGRQLDPNRAENPKENSTRDILDTIKNILSEKKNKGPFDIEPKKTYWSPYNKVLLNFIEGNLLHIMPESFGDYEFSYSFLKDIKTFFWNED
ncbi:expressed protein, partial [Phakopsora pachyrhizi]